MRNDCIKTMKGTIDPTVKYLSHSRIMWLLKTGKMPVEEVVSVLSAQVSMTIKWLLQGRDQMLVAVRWPLQGGPRCQL